MARNDIRPFRAANGGSNRIKTAPSGGTNGFAMGEPVVWDGAGGIEEAVDDPAAIFGITAVDNSPTEVSAFIGRYLTRPAGTLIQCYDIDQDQFFTCANFMVDGAAATPTQANAIGALGGLDFGMVTDLWSVDTGTGPGNFILQIDDVIDARGNSLTDPNVLNTAGVAVVFHFTL
jgi:hypothetical protein